MLNIEPFLPAILSALASKITMITSIPDINCLVSLMIKDIKGLSYLLLDLQNCCRCL